MPDTSKASTMTGDESSVRVLGAYDVQHIFGLCGDTTLPFHDAFYSIDRGIEHILRRDERCAAYMADGYARVTEKVGVRKGPSGGGATYILPGLVDANEADEDSVPILEIASDVGTRSKDHYPLTELEPEGLMRPLTKFIAAIQHSDAIPDMARTAFRKMTTGRSGAAHLGLTIDVQRGTSNLDVIWADPRHRTFPAYPSGPDADALSAALDAILSAEFPVIICGGGIVLSQGKADSVSIVEALDIAVATTISGQGSVPETHPNCVGVVGSNGGEVPTRELVQKADLVVFIGCRAGSLTTELWRYPVKGTRIVHLDSDPEVIGAPFPAEVGVVSDARLALAALNAELAQRDPQPGFGGAATLAGPKAREWVAFHEPSDSAERPIRPERTIAALRAVPDDDAIIVGDPGTPCPRTSAKNGLRTTGRTLFSNRARGVLGYARSAATRAVERAPGKKVVSMMGDGSFGFTCGELETVVRKNLPTTFIVFPNSVEQPVKMHEREALAEITRAVDVPILADESVFNTRDALLGASMRLANAFSLKIAKSGGIRRALQISAIARAAGIEVYGGCMFETSIAHAAGAHLMAAVPDLILGCEYYMSTYYAEADIATAPFPVRDGVVHVPTAPGLGVAVDKDKMAHYRTECLT